MNDRWNIYKDAAGHWRWEHLAANNRVVGASSESYQGLLHCVENAFRNGMTAEDLPAAIKARFE